MKPIILIIAFSTLVFRVIAQDKVSVTGARVTEVGIYTARVIKKFDAPGITGGTNEGLDSFLLVHISTALILYSAVYHQLCLPQKV